MKVPADPNPPVSSTEEYQAIMTVAKVRLFTIKEMLEMGPDGPVSKELPILEMVHLQFRLLIELIYISAIVARRDVFAPLWGDYKRTYDPNKIRRLLGDERDLHFPYPMKRLPSPPGTHSLEFLPRPIEEAETFAFFTKCSDLCHEKNPYRRSFEDRDAECAALRESATEKLTQFWGLLKFHHRTTELADGTRIPMMCSMGKEKDDPVSVAQAQPMNRQQTGEASENEE